MIDQSNKYTFLLSLKPDTITMNDIFYLFNKKVIKNPDGSTSIEHPLFEPYEEFTAPKGSLISIKEDTKTTVGRYIFNLVTLAYAYGDKFPYLNYTVKNAQLEDLMNSMCDELLMGRITGEEYGKFQTRVVWLNNFSELFIPGDSINLISLPKEIKDELQRLVNENKQIILDNVITEYTEKVEKPILAFAEKWYKDHGEPGWLLYSKGGKPSFSNTFKNMYLALGGIRDMASGKIVISTASYSDSIPANENSLYANQAAFGIYQRAVNTQFSGAKTKEFAQAFQSVIITEEDCGSQLTIGIDVTKSNVESIKWRWIRDLKNPKEFILVTPDTYKSYIGKHVEFRSPMTCMSDNICWKCMGDLYKRLGLKNAGLASQRLTSTFLQKSLKNMHDQTIKTTKIDWKNIFYEE